MSESIEWEEAHEWNWRNVKKKTKKVGEKELKLAVQTDRKYEIHEYRFVWNNTIMIIIFIIITVIAIYLTTNNISRLNSISSKGWRY